MLFTRKGKEISCNILRLNSYLPKTVDLGFKALNVCYSKLHLFECFL